MKVFIEQPGKEKRKNVFDKETGMFLKTVPIDVTYPYPYGYILDTLAADGDELDCYVLTRKKLETASVVECEPIGMVEWFEDGDEDHKILTVLQGESREVDEEVKRRITEFANHFFDDKPEKKYRLGAFLSKDAALALLKRSSKKYSYRNRAYDVVSYDPRWPSEFESQASKIRAIFGSDIVGVEHVGSTAVPGMNGKPVTDILVLVDDVSVADKHRAEMESAGYDYAGDFVMPGAILFRKMNGETLLSNVHVFQREHPHVREMLQLRDYLRDNPGEVKAYSELKKDLYAKYKEDYAQYRKHKDEYMEELKRRAVKAAP
jgi:GrpB-like predicted nucleotidyltransferase (UPF0157 family)